MLKRIRKFEKLDYLLRKAELDLEFLFCNHSAFYDDFSILTRENEKFLLELKESLLIMRDKPSLNRNITLAPLYLFDRA